jgi:hypothetical protein
MYHAACPVFHMQCSRTSGIVPFHDVDLGAVMDQEELDNQSWIYMDLL